MHAIRVLCSVLLCCVVSAGCASQPPARSGFLSDYGHLEKAEKGAIRYVSPELKSYDRFIVDPVELRMDVQKLTPAERAEVARYMHDACERMLRNEGIELTTTAGVGVARFRVAITEIQKSKWYLSLHPASKVTGAGTGGASMEAEIIDSVSGEQLAAVVRAGRGNQFELDTFNALDDVKDVIDRWAEEGTKRLKELRSGT